MATVQAPSSSSSPKLTIPIVDAHVSALWTLIAIEIGSLLVLRRYFRRFHGG